MEPGNSAESESNKISMVVFSGDMDKVMAAYNIAVGAAASGMDVTMFFTFWGIKAIQNGGSTGTSLFGKMLGLLNRGGIDRIGPSRLNMGGLGRWMFKKMMKAHNVTPLRELQQMAAVAGVGGVAALIEDASRSKATLFI